MTEIVIQNTSRNIPEKEKWFRGNFYNANQNADGFKSLRKEKRLAVLNVKSVLQKKTTKRSAEIPEKGIRN